MLKKEITYENFDGEAVTETFYFHLGKTDLFEMDIEHDDGLEVWLKNISESKDKKALYYEFKRLILATYGERSEDGKRFIKSKELSDMFSQTGAYEALFMELVSDENAAVEFLVGCLPKDIGEEARKRMEAPSETAERPVVETKDVAEVGSDPNKT